jgi:hypothetical protein
MLVEKFSICAELIIILVPYQMDLSKSILTMMYVLFPTAAGQYFSTSQLKAYKNKN